MATRYCLWQSGLLGVVGGTGQVPSPSYTAQGLRLRAAGSEYGKLCWVRVPLTESALSASNKTHKITRLMAAVEGTNVKVLALAVWSGDVLKSTATGWSFSSTAPTQLLSAAANPSIVYTKTLEMYLGFQWASTGTTKTRTLTLRSVGIELEDAE